MAYTINKTNGTIFATIQDGTIDNTTSSLIMIGKNYAGWGEALDENFVKLLESHANPTAPTTPHKGQLWFDTSNGILTVYDGEDFKSLAASTTAIVEPTENIVGDMWYDTVNSQLNIYDGTQYIVVGPSFTASGTTGSIIEVMEDILSVSHTVVKIYVDSEVVAVFSKDAAFTPIGADQIPGFSTVIYPGIQLALTLTGQVPHFTGTATNSDLLDNLDSTQFLRSDAADTTSEHLSILNDSGLTVGGAGEGELNVSLGDVYLKNTINGGDLFININSGTVDTTVITIDSVTARARVATPTNGTDIVNMDYVTNTAVAINGSSTMTGSLDMGTNKVVNAVDPVADLTTDMQDVATKNYILNLVFSAIYTVGSYFMGPNPNGKIPGTWTQVPANTFLMASGSGYGATGGSNSKTLSIAEMPVHNHTATFSGNALPAHSHTLDLHRQGSTYYDAWGTNGSFGHWNAGTTNAVSAGTPSGSISVGNRGSGAAWDLRPQYESVEVWKRTA